MSTVVKLYSAGVLLLLVAVGYFFKEQPVIQRFSKPLWSNRRSFIRKAKLANLAFRMKKMRKSVKRKEWVLIGVCSILITATVGTGNLFKPLFISALLVSMLSLFVARSRIDAQRINIARDLAVFGECVDMYIRTGYPLRKAMETAALSTPHIRRPVHKALRYWSSGAHQALDMLETEIGIPEAQSLIMVLKSIEASGIKNAKDTLEREAKNIQRLQDFKKKQRLSARPMYFVVFRMLPFGAILGIIGGTMVVRVITYIDALVRSNL